MAHAPLVPPLDVDIHLVLCRFGRAGLAYVETDPTEADATTVVRNLLYGQYGEPLRVVALNVEEGWSRDVSGAIAHKVLQIARQDEGLSGFLCEAFPSCAHEALFEHDGESRLRLGPLSRRSFPIRNGVVQNQI